MTKDASGTWKVVVATAALAVASTKLAEVGWKKYQLQNDKKTNTDKKVITGKAAYDDGLFREQLARNYAFLGEEGMENVKNQYVVVVGAGGGLTAPAKQDDFAGVTANAKAYMAEYRRIQQEA